MLIPRVRPRRRQHGRLYSARSSKALMAAGRIAAATEAQRGMSDRASGQNWQARAFGYYDLLGECWNPAQFYARGMAKIRFFPAFKNDDGTIEEIEDGLAVEALRDIEHVAPEYGRLMFLVGEGRLCQSRHPDAEPDADIEWEFLSPTEIKPVDEGRKIERRSADDNKPVVYVNISDDDRADEPAPGEMRMWRMWRKHPQNSGLPDSPVRPVLDLYEQLWWLTMGERADLHNRIADSGILLVPEEIDFGGETAEDQAADDDPETDPFLEYLGDVMMTAISDPGSAAAAVPVVVRGPGEHLTSDRFRLLHTHDPASTLFTSQREEAIIRRIAMGLDLPVEEVLGLSNANHWTAWKVEDQKWQHLEPVATLFANDFANLYLRPLLRANGEDATDIVVGYDNSAFARDPDKGKTAITLHKEGLLAAEATLEANGWEVEHRMPDDEHDEWLAIQLKQVALIDPSLAPQPEQEQDEEAPPEEPEADGRDDAEQAQRARVAQFATLRARAAIGTLARSAKRTCPDCLNGTERVEAHRLPGLLGRERLAALGNGDTARYTLIATRAFMDTLSHLGYDADERVVEGFFVETVDRDDPWPGEMLAFIRPVAGGGR